MIQQERNEADFEIEDKIQKSLLKLEQLKQFEDLQERKKYDFHQNNQRNFQNQSDNLNDLFQEIKIFNQNNNDQFKNRFDEQTNQIHDILIDQKLGIQVCSNHQLDWEDEKEKIILKIKKNNDIVKLDVGGSIMKTNYENFEKIHGSLLQQLVSGKHKGVELNDSIFIDRDPSIFGQLFSMLRDELQIPYKLDKFTRSQLEIEMKFWGVYDLVMRVQFSQKQLQLIDKLQYIFSQVPNRVDNSIQQLWQQLGPFDVKKAIFRSENFEINEDSTVGNQEQQQNMHAYISGQFIKDQRNQPIAQGMVRIQTQDYLYEGIYCDNTYCQGLGRQIKILRDEIDQSFIYTGLFKDGLFHGHGQLYYFLREEGEQIKEGEFYKGQYYGLCI